MARRTGDQYPPLPEKWTPPNLDGTEKDSRVLFVHSCVDEYGLSAAEFRVLCHVARRAGKERGCDASQAKIAAFCGISQRRVLEILRVLVQANILSRSKAKGGRHTNQYRVNPARDWKHPSILPSIRSREKTIKESDEPCSE